MTYIHCLWLLGDSIKSKENGATDHFGPLLIDQTNALESSVIFFNQFKKTISRLFLNIIC